MAVRNIRVIGDRMEPRRIYAGTRGSYITEVAFTFSGEWDGLTKKLIFYPVRGKPVYINYTYGSEKIPYEVMRYSGDAIMLMSGYSVEPDGSLGVKIVTASAFVAVDPAESDTQNEPDIPEATEFEKIVAKLGAPYIGENGNWFVWDVYTNEFADTGLPARGEQGETGRGLTILGKYGSLDDLRASVKDAQPGDAYAVGEKAPYTIYIWDDVSGDFTNHGDLRGVGITKIEQITDNTGSGEPNTICIYTDDGAEYDYTVYNGERGHPGNIWIGETEPPDDSYTIWLNPGGAVSGFLESHQGTENAGHALVVGEDGIVRPGKAKGSVELDTTLTQSGKAADAKAVGDALAEQEKTIPIVFDWAKAELPFTEAQISNTSSSAGFVVNPTNFADGKTYFRYHAGATNFTWTNPNPQVGAVTITVLSRRQWDATAATSSRLNIVYSDGTTDVFIPQNGAVSTYTTNANKVLSQIKGNYDIENWVLLDMDVLSIVADYPAPTGTVKSVNGNLPDENGNVTIETGGGNANIDVTAEVGQTIVVKSIDENGKPTAWEAVGFPKEGWRRLSHWEKTDNIVIQPDAFDVNTGVYTVSSGHGLDGDIVVAPYLNGGSPVGYYAKVPAQIFNTNFLTLIVLSDTTFKLQSNGADITYTITQTIATEKFRFESAYGYTSWRNIAEIKGLDDYDEILIVTSGQTSGTDIKSYIMPTAGLRHDLSWNDAWRPIPYTNADGNKYGEMMDKLGKADIIYAMSMYINNVAGYSMHRGYSMSFNGKESGNRKTVEHINIFPKVKAAKMEYTYSLANGTVFDVYAR
jgi:hypothetical protein